MLSIGKLGQGQERYYLEAVAEGAEDYYVFAGEAPGRWAGGGSRSLELHGQVAGTDFTALLMGQDPRSGQLLGRRQSASKVPGFDLTFSAPKSVSLLFALGDDELSRTMRDAHDAAVADALGYLERTASHGRRGHGGLERIRTSGFVAAVFRHRTSRAGDPNLHSHVVVANRVPGVDGRWSALDARALYVQAKTAGCLYQASLRYQLRELGLSWTVAPSGVAEIDGVPREVRRAFSRRREQIQQHLAERGLTSARAAQVANLQTRKVKDRGVDPDRLRHEWVRRAAELGFDREAIEALLQSGRQRPRPAKVDLSPLLEAAGLTAQASSFGERDVLRAVAVAHGDGLCVERVEEAAADLLTSDRVVELSQGELALRGQDRLRRRAPGGGRVVPMGASERRFSTPELLAIEAHLVGHAVASARVGAVLASEPNVQRALARRPLLNAEQVAMVERLTRGQHGVDVVDAAAGAGKTTALGAVAEAYASSEVPILGAALSAKAAGVLRDQTGMPTFTVARLLVDLRDPRVGGLSEGTVLVVDEAGQVGTRALAELYEHVRLAKGRLVLVGDPHQLPEIDAGGAFRGLLHRLDAVHLVSNHRQVDVDEQARLLQLRRGSVAEAMSSYDEAGRVTRCTTSDQLRDRLVQDWAQAYSDAEGVDIDRARADVVMLGLTNADVDDLNRRAQSLLLEQGLLGEDELVLGERRFRVGDHVVTRQNDRRVGVLNGQRWRVAELRPEGLLLVPVGRVGAAVELPAPYVVAHHNRLQHAYAITTAVSQGSSVDRAFVLGSDATYREAGYTAASRARQGTQFYVVEAGQSEVDEERHVGLRMQPDEQDPLAELVAALGRSRAQALALDTSSGKEPTYAAERMRVERSELLRERIHLSKQLGGPPRDLRAKLARLRAEHEEALRRVSVPVDAPRAGRQGRGGLIAGGNTHGPQLWAERAAALAVRLHDAELQQQVRLLWEAEHRQELDRLQELAGLLVDPDVRLPSREYWVPDVADSVGA